MSVRLKTQKVASIHQNAIPGRTGDKGHVTKTVHQILLKEDVLSKPKSIRSDLKIHQLTKDKEQMAILRRQEKKIVPQLLARCAALLKEQAIKNQEAVILGQHHMSRASSKRKMEETIPNLGQLSLRPII